MKGRILLAIVVVAGVSMVLFGVPLGFSLTRVYRQERVIELERLAARSQTEVVEDLAKHETVLDTKAVPAHAQLAFYDLNGTRLIGRGPRQLRLGRGSPSGRARSRHGARPVLLALHNRVADADIRGMIVTAIPVTRGDVVIGALRAAEPRALMLARARRTWMAMGALMIGILAVAAGLGRALARRMLKPLEALGVAASRLGEGDFTARVPVVDVAEFDALGGVLNATAAHLGDLVARERSFSSDASHQLRTPLTGLRLRLERSLPAPAEHHQAMVDAIALVDGLCGTVEQLLALARDLPVERCELDAPQILSEVAARIRPVLWDQRRTIGVVVDPHCPMIRASTPAVREILDVLASNAVVHGRGHVTLRARDAGGGIALEVTDQGPGVAHDVSQIFQRRSSATTGHGIGLALARSLAEAEGGRLVLQRSGPNPTFSLMLLADDKFALDAA